MIIQTPAERDKMKTLAEENAQLKAMIADLMLEKAVLESTVAVIERDYGIDVKKTNCDH